MLNWYRETRQNLQTRQRTQKTTKNLNSEVQMEQIVKI